MPSPFVTEAAPVVDQLTLSLATEAAVSIR
jgi:hypothetical protein